MTAILNTLAPIQIGTTVIPVMDVSLSLGAIEEGSIHSGQLFPTLRLIKGSAPQATFRAPFEAVYAIVGMGAYVATTFDIYLAKFASLVKSTSSDHQKLALSTSASALITIESVSVSQDGLLMAECRARYKSADGTTHPITRTVNNAMVALAAQPNIHTNGPAKLANTTVDGVRGWSVDLNHNVEELRSDGDLYPSEIIYKGSAPQVSIDFSDPLTALGTTGLLGLNASTTSIVYAKRYSTTTGEVVGGATAVSITMAGGYINPQDMAAAVAGVATQGVRIFASNGTADTNPLTVSVSATAP
jgi:hypothetical protein